MHLCTRFENWDGHSDLGVGVDLGQANLGGDPKSDGDTNTCVHFYTGIN